MPSISLWFEQNGEHFFMQVFFTSDLEVQLAIDAEDPVAAGEGVADAGRGGGDAIVILVVRLEVAGAELYVLAGTVLEAEADAAGIDDERQDRKSVV